MLTALKARRQGRISQEQFDEIANRAVLDALRVQEEAGVDIVTDGEQRRDNFFSFVAHTIEGVRLMSLAEMLDYVEDKASYEEMLRTMDVPAFAMFNPIAIGRISRRKPLALEDYLFLRRHTTRPVKVTVPGPYLLTRAMWLQGVSQHVYPTKEHLADDVVAVLREELVELARAGADFIQLDEPVLSELVFSSRVSSRVFMCASLSIRNTPTEELELAVDLVNRVTSGLSGIKGTTGATAAADGGGMGMRIGLHVCRGNWSRREEVLLRGPYGLLMPYLERMQVDQLVLEYATPRAGELADMQGWGRELGLGVVNPRTDEIEPPEAIIQRVEEALRYIPPEKVFLNPDCGFGTFANRPLNSPDIARSKLAAMVHAAAVLRARFARPEPAVGCD
jgi:5-methyltetrahydropteroyltriglutamate--homocysteine methyltransferase